MATRIKRFNPNRCDASGYQLTGRDFYDIDSKGCCGACGKPVKVREFNGKWFIPAHNRPVNPA